MKTFIALLAMLQLSGLALNTKTDFGEVTGRVYNVETSEGLAFGIVVLYLDKVQVITAQTDFDGKYIIKPVNPGTYSLKIAYIGFNTAEISNVKVEANMTTTQDIMMTPSGGIALQEIMISASPIIERDKTIVTNTITSQEIKQISTRGTTNTASLGANVFQRDDDGLNISGSRSNATKYYIDGIPMRESINIPSSAIEQLSVITGGTPARYEGPGVEPMSWEFKKTIPSDKEPEVVYVPPPPPVYYPKYNTEEYSEWIENEFLSVNSEPLSTFSIDVDRASYANARRYITASQLPPAQSVRIEEMINYFTYDYSNVSGEHPFSVTMEVGVCPWNPVHQLMMVGLQGKKIDMAEAPPANLVFLLDVSGSMMSEDKLPLLKKCFNMLIDQLRPQDQVTIVVYAGAAGLVLKPTSGDEKQKIRNALNSLNAGGSTAGAQGITLAYEMAKDNFKEKGNNRVILATDGDFNVGLSSDSELEKLIEERRNDGIFLSVLGFGTGNIKDSKMEILADKGNGNYAYIDNLLEGKKVFVKELGGTLITIAKDVKLQLEFNPTKIQSYRLVGYETRLLRNEDFNDDTKDAGEIGSGHSVTAFYEIIPVGAEELLPQVDDLKYQKKTMISDSEVLNEWVNVKIRYKEPAASESKLLSVPFSPGPPDSWVNSENFLFAAAVAEFGMILRDSEFKADAKFEDVLALAKQSMGKDEEGYRHEFLQLVEKAELISKDYNASKE